MRAVRHETFGDPAEVLSLAEIPDLHPARGQILLRVTLSPIHNHDLWTIRGSYGVRPDLPATGGSEAVGIVEAVGPEVDPTMVGRRVAVAGLQGSWAEFALAPAAAAIPVPEAMTDEAAAQLIAMPFSAITLLEFLGVKEGERVIQTAANGAVGKILSVLAEARGIKVLNLVRRAAAAEELAAAGNLDTLGTDDPNWLKRARDIVGPEGARAAVDSVGGEVAGGLVELLGEDGLLVTFGSMTGEPLQLPTGPIIFKQLTVKGFWGSKVMPATPEADRQRMFAELIGLVMDGRLSLTSGGTFGLDQAAEAVRASLSPGRSGKIMFRP